MSSVTDGTDMQGALDYVVLAALRPVAAGLAVLYAVFAFSHAVLLPAGIAVLLAAVAASTAAMLFGLFVALRRWAIPAHWAHPIGAAVSGLVLLNSLLHLALTAEPLQTTNLMLLVIGAGFLLLSTRCLALVITATVIGWLLVVWAAGPSPVWQHFGFALLTSTVLGVLVHTVRVRTLSRLERLRLYNQLQNVELDAVLQDLGKSEAWLEKKVKERTQELRQALAQLLEQQRLQRDVELAAQIQNSLLPDRAPALDGFDLSAVALPARYVSGDLYDFFSETSQEALIFLADISGKGIPAALLASQARALVYAEASRNESLAGILSSVNSLFYKDLSRAEMFITLMVARLDTRSGRLVYANAGHPPALWWQQAHGACRQLPATGLPIGVFSDLAIGQETIVLQPGDVLIFYSDGVTEAENGLGEFFGVDRLLDVLLANAHLQSDELSRVIVENVERFCSQAPLSDDLTLVILKALPRTVDFANPADREGT
ncbi:MAG: PP2C family protein-serine/threonine phosphatase [Anaerolineae bacterium]|nr:PP2C family protein-serine/threonine phosphatase [Anaerolineae bacterium]